MSDPSSSICVEEEGLVPDPQVMQSETVISSEEASEQMMRSEVAIGSEEAPETEDANATRTDGSTGSDLVTVC